MPFFRKPDVCQDFIASLRSAFQSKIGTLKSGKVREKLHGKVRESQGVFSELAAWNPGQDCINPYSFIGARHGLSYRQLVDISPVECKGYKIKLLE